jgi:MFS transporter, putative metabolite:H+ symporter
VESPIQPAKGSLLESDSEELPAREILARLERIPVSAWHVRARLIVGVATLFDGVDTLTIAYVLPVLVGAWHLTPASTGFLISGGYAGQLVGGILSGWLAERIGRRRTMQYTVAAFAILSLLCALSWNYSSLLVFRTLQGLGLGGEVPVAAVYINELAQARNRGRFFLIYEQAYSAGRLLAALLGVWVVVNLGWRYMFLIGGLPAIMVIFLRRNLPESPRWLVGRGRIEEARRALDEIESRTRVQARLQAPLQECVEPPERPAPERTSIVGKSEWRELFSAAYRTRTFTTWILWFSAFLLLNGLSNWVPTLYTAVFHLPVKIALRYGALSSACGFAGCIAVAFLIEWTGRRPWYIAAFFCAGLACLAIWYLGASPVVAVVILTCVTAFFVNSIAMVVFLHTPEIYPTRMRALATSAASSWLRVASIAAPAFIAFTMGRTSLAVVFLGLGSVAWVAAIVAAMFTVETKGRVLEDIAQ